jgi:hypothetical protein
MSKMNLAFAFSICCWCVFAGYTNNALAGGDSACSLPAGQYVFLGEDPAGAPQKTFRIDSNGAVHWHTSTGSTGETSMEQAGKPGENWISNKYPVIKWKGRMVQGGIRAVAELTTSFEYDTVKYQISLGKPRNSPFWHKNGIEGIFDAAAAQGLTVEFLDKDGFKLWEFRIPGKVLNLDKHQEVIEGRATAQMPEHLYSKTYDWRVR